MEFENVVNEKTLKKLSKSHIFIAGVIGVVSIVLYVKLVGKRNTQTEVPMTSGYPTGEGYATGSGVSSGGVELAAIDDVITGRLDQYGNNTQDMLLSTTNEIDTLLQMERDAQAFAGEHGANDIPFIEGSLTHGFEDYTLPILPVPTTSNVPPRPASNSVYGYTNIGGKYVNNVTGVTVGRKPAPSIERNANLPNAKARTVISGAKRHTTTPAPRRHTTAPAPRRHTTPPRPKSNSVYGYTNIGGRYVNNVTGKIVGRKPAPSRDKNANLPNAKARAAIKRAK